MNQSIASQIRSLQHIGIPVTDIKKSESFYRQFGFENKMQANFPYNKDEKGVCIMMQLGAIIIELYEMPEPDRTEVSNRRNGHIDHIAFDVADINLAYETVAAMGYKPLEAAPVYLAFWDKGCKYFNIVGPDGERLEFNQILA